MQNVAHENAGPLRKVNYVLAAVKFEQSLFALPFAYIGMLLAADGLPELQPFIWVSLAMVGARNAGMAVNRVFDRNIDALNPRTADRHLPQGLLRPWELSTLAIAGLALYFVAAWQLNPLALALSPIGALFVVGYSTVKRFSWLTHVTLGMTLAIAPAGGWVGVTGELAWEAVLLYAVVATFATGFDIFNTVGDMDFDRGHGIKALPARFGIHAAFWVSRTMHVLTASALLALGLWLDLAWPYFIGWGIAAVLLVYEHRILKPDDMSRVRFAFTWINASISVAVLLFTFIAVVVV
jgi:4-hydroxybenzoate polyprenyltransferase